LHVAGRQIARGLPSDLDDAAAAMQSLPLRTSRAWNASWSGLSKIIPVPCRMFGSFRPGIGSKYARPEVIDRDDELGEQ
jgi:hypothetical protein